MNVITCQNVKKEYKAVKKKPGLKGAVENLFKREVITKRAINDFSFTIAEGEFIGFIGPNGAGKTTMMKLLTGIINPTEGKIDVLGYEPGKLQREYKKQFALVMGQKSQLWWDLPAIDSFLLNKEIYNISDKDFADRLSYFTEIFKLEDILNVQVRKLSLGERMKMELIANLLHNPKILFLDEPTIGLDVVAQEAIHYFLREVNEKLKVTIILTSHYMEEIKELCNRVIIVNEGNKVYDGDWNTLVARYTEMKKLVISYGTNTKIDSIKAGLLDYHYEIDEEKQYVTVLAEKEKIGGLLKMILEKSNVSDITIEEEEISSVIQKIYKETS